MPQQGRSHLGTYHDIPPRVGVVAVVFGRPMRPTRCGEVSHAYAGWLAASVSRGEVFAHPIRHA